MEQPGRNSPVAILIAVLAVVAIIGLVYQRQNEIDNNREIDRMVDEIVEDSGG